MYGYSKIPANLWGLILAFSLFVYFNSPNILIVFPLLLYILWIYKLFYIKGNPNIIFWGLIFQWAAISSQPIYASILGVPLGDLFLGTIFPADLMEYTDFLSIAGIYFFTTGLFWSVRRFRIILNESIWDKYDPNKVFRWYIYISSFILLNQAVIWNFPGLVQYIFFLFYVKWGFFVFTFMIIFKRGPQLKVPLLAVIGFEFLLGLSSYFASNFYLIILFSVIAFAALVKRISLSAVSLLWVVGALLFHMAVLWTAAKGNYRSYVNQGQNVQEVKVSKEEARSKLIELIQKVDANTYNRAIEDLVNRLGYVHFFAAAVRYVPEYIPHENGKILINALSHYLIPRFLNPDKPELDDSKHTNRYTGLNLSGKSKGTSFSLGTFADAYVDFGPILMFIPLFFFGYLIGLFYKLLYTADVWGVIFTAPFFLLINVYGADTTKAIGGILIYFFVIYFLKNIIRSNIDSLIRYNGLNETYPRS